MEIGIFVLVVILFSSVLMVLLVLGRSPAVVSNSANGTSAEPNIIKPIEYDPGKNQHISALSAIVPDSSVCFQI